MDDAFISGENKEHGKLEEAHRSDTHLRIPLDENKHLSIPINSTLLINSIDTKRAIGALKGWIDKEQFVLFWDEATPVLSDLQSTLLKQYFDGEFDPEKGDGFVFPANRKDFGFRVGKYKYLYNCRNIFYCDCKKNCRYSLYFTVVDGKVRYTLKEPKCNRKK